MKLPVVVRKKCSTVVNRPQVAVDGVASRTVEVVLIHRQQYIERLYLFTCR